MHSSEKKLKLHLNVASVNISFSSKMFSESKSLLLGISQFAWGRAQQRVRFITALNSLGHQTREPLLDALLKWRKSILLSGTIGGTHYNCSVVETETPTAEGDPVEFPFSFSSIYKEERESNDISYQKVSERFKSAVDMLFLDVVSQLLTPSEPWLSPSLCERLEVWFSSLEV